MIKSRGSRRTIKAIVLVLGLACLLGVARMLYLEEQGNFHPITPGEAYRSAQLDQDELEYYIRKYAIRSVINLRGVHHDEKWYRDETEICRRLGVAHYDVDLSSDKAPNATQLRDLLGFFATAHRPVLIHCQAGADRSGLAAALWKLVVDRTPKSVARKQFSILYGHIPFGPTQALDDFFEKYEPGRGPALSAE
jgi:protein tyrosine/serine phosphatase